MGPVHLHPHQMFLLVPSPSEVPRRNWGRKRGRSSPEQFGNQNNQMTPLLIPRRFLKDIACKRWFLLRFFFESHLVNTITHQSSPGCSHSVTPRITFSVQFSFYDLTFEDHSLVSPLFALTWKWYYCHCYGVSVAVKKPSSIGKSSWSLRAWRGAVPS